MSCFNSDTWLAEAIESVLCQSFDDFEFVIVDDGSTDKSKDIIAKYAKVDERILTIPKKNSGLADSLNVGLQQARGEWIARIDSDDLCEPERFADQLAFVDQHPKTALLGSGTTIMDAQGSQEHVYLYPTRHRVLVRHLLLSQSFFPHSSALYRRDLAIEIRGYRSFFVRSQDFDLWLRLSMIGKMAALRKPLVKIRRHDGQISNDQSGFRQYLYSRAALVSYYSKLCGIQDPVEDCPVELTEWLAKTVSDNQMFDTFRGSDRIKRILGAENTPFLRRIGEVGIVDPIRALLDLYSRRRQGRVLSNKWVAKIK